MNEIVRDGYSSNKQCLLSEIIATGFTMAFIQDICISRNEVVRAASQETEFQGQSDGLSVVAYRSLMSFSGTRSRKRVSILPPKDMDLPSRAPKLLHSISCPQFNDNNNTCS